MRSKSSLSDFLTDNELHFELNFDGQIHRYKPDKSGWYLANRKDVGDKTHVWIVVGNWKTGEKFVYKSYDETDEDVKSELEKKKCVEAVRSTMHECISEIATSKFKALKRVKSETVPYLKNKKIIGLDVFEQLGILYVPLQDIDRKIWSYQTIDDKGRKFFARGGRKKGCMTFFGKLTEKLYMCEGFATACTIHQSTGCFTICTMDAGNMIEVAKELARHDVYKDMSIVICADNDHLTEKQTGNNPGLTAAKKAKAHLRNAVIAAPRFKYGDAGSDFNDAFCLYGEDEALKQLGEIYDAKKDKNAGYDEYKEFFDKLFAETLGGCKQNILDGEYYTFDDTVTPKRWRPTLNLFDRIKANSYANSRLQPTKVKEYLAEYLAREIGADFLFKVAEWDGVDRIGELIDKMQIKNVSKYCAKELFKEWCANVFRRVHNNRKYQNKMMVFKGAQGLGKDTFIESIFHAMDDSFGTFSVDLHNEQRNFDSIRNSMVLNISEFDKLAKMNIAMLKAMITQNDAKYRSSYAAKSEKFPLTCSFITSCNTDDILRDTTGNRRFVILEVGDIDWSYDKNSEQYIAQMNYLAKTAFFADEKAVKEMDEYVISQSPDDPVEYIVDSYVTYMRAATGLVVGDERRLEPSKLDDFFEKIARDINKPKKHVQHILKLKGYFLRTNRARYYIYKEKGEIVTGSDA